MTLFKGSGVAIVTPFKNDGSIDYEVLNELLEFHVSNQTDAIVITGTTGESATLSDEEQLSLIDFTVKTIAGRIPVIAGTGSNNTAHMVHLSVEAEKLGVDGLLCVTPYYNKTTQEGLYQHFLSVSKEVNVPIILYNVPGRTNINLSAETTYRLSSLDNVVGLKDASGDMGLALEVRRLCGPDFALYSGNDDMIVPLLSLGGVGVISVVANILPKETHDLVMDYLEKGENTLQIKYKALIDALFVEPSPIPVKAALKLMGYESQSLRLPLVPATQATRDLLSSEMKKVGML
ncbi:MAG: 4-hydroxy-tetrahydrodipicolinate synthase [Erysipelothrix sp.]|nr:4-hydroxy-tetrahydrodipicolinate synthase [Erysipelothrix sp.]